MDYDDYDDDYDGDYNTRHEERRQDVDGGWYTRDEFFDEYGGLDQWDTAGQPAAAAAVSSTTDPKVAGLVGLDISNSKIAKTDNKTGKHHNKSKPQIEKQVMATNKIKGETDPKIGKQVIPKAAVMSLISDEVDVANASPFAQCVCGPSGADPPAPPPAPESTVANADGERFKFDTPSPDDIAKARRHTRALNNAGTANVPLKLVKPPAAASAKDRLNLVVAGHVDAGKSTLMGHLLVKLSAIDTKTLRKFKKESKAMNKSSFHFAWVMDEHGAERERGITMDVGINHFETKTKRITLLDAPGHSDYVPKMISGAAQADVGILVVPANAGEFESAFSDNAQTKEHATLILALGVEQLIVAINKMDAVGWDKSRFEFVQTQLSTFLVSQGYKPENVRYVPVSGYEGHNLMHNPNTKGASADTKYAWGWYKGPSIIDAIDTFKPKDHLKAATLPLRLCINDIFTPKDIFAGPKGLTAVGGKIESGSARVGDVVAIMPMNIAATVKTLVLDEQKVACARVGDNVEVGLADVSTALLRLGNVVCSRASPIAVAARFRAMVRTLGCLQVPLIKGREFILHLQSIERVCHVKKLNKIKSGAGAKPKGAGGKPKKPRRIPRNVTAVIEIVVSQPICCERFADSKTFGRFLLRERGSTVCVGRILKILK